MTMTRHRLWQIAQFVGTAVLAGYVASRIF
jgi:hypothetical protein